MKVLSSLILVNFNFKNPKILKFALEFIENEEKQILSNTEIDFESEKNEKFPSSFTFGYKSQGEDYKFEFVQIDSFDTHTHVHEEGRVVRSSESVTVYLTF